MVSSQVDFSIPITDQISEVGELEGQDAWQRAGKRDYILCDMVEVRQDVGKIWKAIVI